MLFLLKHVRLLIMKFNSSNQSITLVLTLLMLASCGSPPTQNQVVIPIAKVAWKQSDFAPAVNACYESTGHSLGHIPHTKCASKKLGIDERSYILSLENWAKTGKFSEKHCEKATKTKFQYKSYANGLPNYNTLTAPQYNCMLKWFRVHDSTYTPATNSSRVTTPSISPLDAYLQHQKLWKELHPTQPVQIGGRNTNTVVCNSKPVWNGTETVCKEK